MDLYNSLIKKKFLIAGPCVIENEDILFEIAESVKKICDEYGFIYIFKASFDKANRTSVQSYRGCGIEKGLKLLEKIKRAYQLPVTTDIHESYQADLVKDVVDIIQIPAFLCRQTDLLIAAANTGKIVNIKKAQFLPAANMRYPAEKVESTGNKQILLTERGSMYGYQNLVVDYTGILDMMNLNYPVVFDATHSVQKPSLSGQTTGGNREYAPYLSYASAAIGVKGFFFEVHPEPEKALSDSSNTISLANFEQVIQKLNRYIEP